MKKALKWGAVAIIAIFILSRPTEAADTGGRIGGHLKDGANSVTQFVTRVVP